MEPRHRFGNLTLLLALASLTLAAFSLGSVWATADDVRAGDGGLRPRVRNG